MSTSGAALPSHDSGRFPGPALASQRPQTPAQHLCGTKLACSCSSKLQNPPVASLGTYVLVEVELRTITTCAPAGASWVLSGVSGFRAIQRYRFQTETPLRRCAELDFVFLPVAPPAGMHTCYPKLKLSTHAASLVAQYLSCKALPETLQKHHVLPETQLRTLAIRAAPRQLGAAIVLSGVSPNGLARSRRNKAPKPETPFR